MRHEFISFEEAGTFRELLELAPWACYAIECEEGHRVFESSSEFEIWLDNLDYDSRICFNLQNEGHK